MKKYILFGIIGVLWPLTVSGQGTTTTMTFVTTVGSPNGVFSELEVKGVELKPEVCSDDTGNTSTCSATVTDVDILEILTRTPAEDSKQTGMIYLPAAFARSGMVGNPSLRPANLGAVQFKNGAALVGNVRILGSREDENPDTISPFASVTVPDRSELSVRTVTPLTLEFPDKPSNFDKDPIPLLTAGVLEASDTTPVPVSAMSIQQIRKGNDFVFKQPEGAAPGGSSVQWHKCQDSAITNRCDCVAGGGTVAIISKGSGQCDKYYVLHN